jgi:hypothetical protein
MPAKKALVSREGPFGEEVILAREGPFGEEELLAYQTGNMTIVGLSDEGLKRKEGEGSHKTFSSPSSTKKSSLSKLFSRLQKQKKGSAPKNSEVETPTNAKISSRLQTEDVTSSSALLKKGSTSVEPTSKSTHESTLNRSSSERNSKISLRSKTEEEELLRKASLSKLQHMKNSFAISPTNSTSVTGILDRREELRGARVRVSEEERQDCEERSAGSRNDSEKAFHELQEIRRGDDDKTHLDSAVSKQVESSEKHVGVGLDRSHLGENTEDAQGKDDADGVDGGGFVKTIDRLIDNMFHGKPDLPVSAKRIGSSEQAIQHEGSRTGNGSERVVLDYLLELIDEKLLELIDEKQQLVTTKPESSEKSSQQAPALGIQQEEDHPQVQRRYQQEEDGEGQDDVGTLADTVSDFGGAFDEGSECSEFELVLKRNLIPKHANRLSSSQKKPKSRVSKLFNRLHNRSQVSLSRQERKDLTSKNPSTTISRLPNNNQVSSNAHLKQESTPVEPTRSPTPEAAPNRSSSEQVSAILLLRARLENVISKNEQESLELPANNLSQKELPTAAPHFTTGHNKDAFSSTNSTTVSKFVHIEEPSGAVIPNEEAREGVEERKVGGANDSSDKSVREVQAILNADHEKPQLTEAVSEQVQSSEKVSEQLSVQEHQVLRVGLDRSHHGEGMEDTHVKDGDGVGDEESVVKTPKGSVYLNNDKSDFAESVREQLESSEQEAQNATENFGQEPVDEKTRTPPLTQKHILTTAISGHVHVDKTKITLDLEDGSSNFADRDQLGNMPPIEKSRQQPLGQKATSPTEFSFLGDPDETRTDGRQDELPSILMNDCSDGVVTGTGEQVGGYNAVSGRFRNDSMPTGISDREHPDKITETLDRQDNDPTILQEEDMPTISDREHSHKIMEILDRQDDDPTVSKILKEDNMPAQVTGQELVGENTGGKNAIPATISGLELPNGTTRAPSNFSDQERLNEATGTLFRHGSELYGKEHEPSKNEESTPCLAIIPYQNWEGISREEGIEVQYRRLYLAESAEQSVDSVGFGSRRMIDWVAEATMMSLDPYLDGVLCGGLGIRNVVSADDSVISRDSSEYSLQSW